MNLTQLARKTLEAYFQEKEFEPNQELKDKFKEKKACFVTLTKNGNLRGCIGSLEPRQELWKDVQENSLNSAFNDPRFFPLQEKELKDIKIEVSVLSKPQKLEYKNEEDLLNKINKEMGIILKKDFCSSTFLPQVWEQIPDKIQFIEQLSLKAGLNKDAWKTSDISYYTADIEEE